MQSDKGKIKETQPSFRVTALAGPPRLSIHNPPPPEYYGKTEPAWVDALSGGPADPSEHDETMFRHMNRVKSTDYSIGYGSEAHHLIVPGLSEDGKLVYQTLHSKRSRNHYDIEFMDNEPSHPSWWDEQMKKSTEWFIKFREDGGTQPPTAEGELKTTRDQDGNLIKDDEPVRKVLSMWSSIVGPDLDEALDKTGSHHRGGSRPHASIITQDDVTTALTSKPYYYGDGPKPPDATLSFNGNTCS
ncbi:hypothetical protein L202_08147 [Cryptococcus amylolentus CBS 6039]|uniref:Uncharacterized protein n=2 Tax=Cryptococcus amylolentus TaxID=104669 RepID=A0A1E3H8P8_9TREE|nr:hypothetical protein L202_08147 [Cryptococcus amylolentus CBS 6039]ODN72708.1 hypothetical protein L202_08147 [Cryptococcus amylolentus CBS 6039]ODN97916.1 hypothetical protein I350_07552 [Cryptococcus amylolentus CBS 6273]